MISKLQILKFSLFFVFLFFNTLNSFFANKLIDPKCPFVNSKQYLKPFVNYELKQKQLLDSVAMIFEVRNTKNIILDAIQFRFFQNITENITLSIEYLPKGQSKNLKTEYVPLTKIEQIPNLSNPNSFLKITNLNRTKQDKTKKSLKRPFFILENRKTYKISVKQSFRLQIYHFDTDETRLNHYQNYIQNHNKDFDLKTFLIGRTGTISIYGGTLYMDFCYREFNEDLPNFTYKNESKTIKNTEKTFFITKTTLKKLPTNTSTFIQNTTKKKIKKLDKTTTYTTETKKEINKTEIKKTKNNETSKNITKTKIGKKTEHSQKLTKNKSKSLSSKINSNNTVKNAKINFTKCKNCSTTNNGNGNHASSIKNFCKTSLFIFQMFIFLLQN